MNVKKIATFVLSCKSTNPYTRYFLALLLFLREAALISQFFVQQILVASSRMGFLPLPPFPKKRLRYFVCATNITWSNNADTHKTPLKITTKSIQVGTSATLEDHIWF
jgi:hypothetical protein